MNDLTNTPIVIAIVNHRARSALKRKPGTNEPRAAARGGRASTLRMNRLSKGAKMTATSQETRSAMVTTANSVKQYSPAELCAKPIDEAREIASRYLRAWRPRRS